VRAGVVLFVTGALLLGVAGAQAAVGDLDTSFGSTGPGYTESDFGGMDDIAYDVVVRKDGKIIVGGDTGGGSDWALTKNDPNGIERSKKTVDLGGSDEEIRALATTNNITYAAGWTNAAGNYDFALAKYDKGLGLDKSFGTNGIARTDFAGGRDMGRAVAIQKDGKILVAGVANWPSGDVAIARYTQSGQLDPTFGTGGKVVLDLSGSGGYDDAVSVVAANGGGIVTAGSAYNTATSSFDWLVAKFTAKGVPDTTFDGDGKRFIDGPGGGSADAAFAIAQYPGSRLVVGGTFDDGIASGVERMNSYGSPDLSFSGDGRELYDSPAQHMAIDGIAVVSTNHIVIAGRTDVNGDDDGLLVFMPPSGGIEGTAVTDLAGNDDEWRGLTKYKNKVVVAGETDSSSDDFILGRYFGP
jgi:uncharacterized delta-60 repeat protein